MVDLALKWTNVPEQESYAVKANIGTEEVIRYGKKYL